MPERNAQWADFDEPPGSEFSAEPIRCHALELLGFPCVVASARNENVPIRSDKIDEVGSYLRLLQTIRDELLCRAAPPPIAIDQIPVEDGHVERAECVDTGCHELPAQMSPRLEGVWPIIG